MEPDYTRIDETPLVTSMRPQVRHIATWPNARASNRGFRTVCQKLGWQSLSALPNELDIGALPLCAECRKRLLKRHGGPERIKRSESGR